MYIYIYIYVCTCVRRFWGCFRSPTPSLPQPSTALSPTLLRGCVGPHQVTEQTPDPTSPVDPKLNPHPSRASDPNDALWWEKFSRYVVEAVPDPFVRSRSFMGILIGDSIITIK